MSETRRSPVEEVELRVEHLPGSHRTKQAVESIGPADNGWDAQIELSHFGRADLNSLHQLCDDWEVQARQPEDGVVILGVDVHGVVPIGGD